MGINLLVVDDSKVSRTEVIRALNGEKSLGTIFEAENGLQALKRLSSQKIDLILSDVVMPGMDGFKLLISLRDHEEWNTIPVILLTSQNELEDRVKGLELGAWDYLIKPANPLELLTRARVMLRIKTLQDKLKNRIRQLERLSIVDGLTGLYNKKYLYEFIRREIKRTERFGMIMFCIMMDVDHFKKVNDTYGHPCGDTVLKELGAILGDVIRGYDFAARFGGDEFTVVLPQQSNRKDVQIIAERLRQTINNHPFTLKSKSKRPPIQITVSLGVAAFPDKNITDYESLIERADEALYQAKLQGRNRIVFT